MKGKNDYLGINGSATYVCRFDNCFVPDHFVLSEDADAFIKKVRPTFLLYQIPLGLGVTGASIESIQRRQTKQIGSNHYLQVQPDELKAIYHKQRKSVYDYMEAHVDTLEWQTLAQIRLDVTYLTLRSVEASMLHNGGAGYLNKSQPARKLREAYFLANLTPTVKQLEKILA
ncbi:hypothetical protein [Virgibacillus natechei]|uniref:hypothetical protein n=1 Tax=Virgibacillus natechei TaxID=1216297 RepID=UPI001FDA7E0B|nr:hypothetical protein [Virgibacillus natechei]UZD12068.1 hypothetical protein OLD84_14135 [Virgibacillus natechei]